MNILSEDEIRQVTHKVRKTAQIKALRQMGIEVKIRPDGSPLVNANHFEQATGGKVEEENFDVKLNLEALSATKKQEKPRKRRPS